VTPIDFIGWQGRVAFGCRAIADGYDRYARWYEVVCPTCAGAGVVGESPAVRAGAPKLWVPDDVGLVLVEESGRTIVAKRAPRRESDRRAPHGYHSGLVELSDYQLADLIRWASVRPDPRHAERNPR